jgi:hypothetical protein
VATIIPGHGLLTSGPSLSRYLAYLSELIESVRKAIRAGQNLEEAIGATSLGQKIHAGRRGLLPACPSHLPSLECVAHLPRDERGSDLIGERSTKANPIP